MTGDYIDKYTTTALVIDRTSACMVLLFPDGERHVQRLDDVISDRLRAAVADFRPDDQAVCIAIDHDGVRAVAVGDDDAPVNLIGEWAEDAQWDLVASLMNAVRADGFRFN